MGRGCIKAMLAILHVHAVNKGVGNETFHNTCLGCGNIHILRSDDRQWKQHGARVTTKKGSK